MRHLCMELTCNNKAVVVSRLGKLLCGSCYIFDFKEDQDGLQTWNA